MSVVTPRSERTESQPIAPSRWRVKDRLAERIARLADKTASQSKEGLPRAAEVGRGDVSTEFKRTSDKLKERVRADRLKQDYREYLLWLHEHVLDPPNEQLFFASTKEPVALAGLTVHGKNRAHGHDYRPTPCRLFEWALGCIDYDLSRLTFVDHGAGKGRVLLLASEHPFQAVTGVEFAEELHDNASMNIQQYPRSRMKCRNVDCKLDDVTKVVPPEGEAVHYFFNPFSPEIFAEVLKGIVVSYRHRPRRFYLVLIDPPPISDLIEASGVFTRVELPPVERMKIKLLSPYEVAIYRTLA
jgi:hypothetical protein